MPAQRVNEDTAEPGRNRQVSVRPQTRGRWVQKLTTGFRRWNRANVAPRAACVMGIPGGSCGIRRRGPAARCDGHHEMVDSDPVVQEKPRLLEGRIMRASAQVTAPVRSPDDRGCEHQTQQTEQEHMLAHVRARAKHPWALGQPLSECWKEIWHVEAAGRHAVQGRTSDME
jgi:hypothetical protein